MSDQSQNVFIGVAWPYVNGTLHVGHLAGYLLPADITSRFHQNTGKKVLMVSGSDCHGTPITVEADKKGKKPEEIVQDYHQKDTDLFLNQLGLSYSVYTQTNTPFHQSVVQKMFLSFLKKGFVKKGTTQQYFSPEENRFLPDRYIEGICPYCGSPDQRSDYCEACNHILDQGEIRNPVSKLSQTEVVLKETQHYFFDWSQVQKNFLPDYIDQKSPLWRDWVVQETKGWLKEGLKERAMTRDLDWGIPLPIKDIPLDQRVENIENKRIYVWFEAVIGYYSASLLWAKMQKQKLSQKEAEQEILTEEEEEILLSDILKDFWLDKSAQHYYFMGQDNLVFHTLFWPGQLYSYNDKLHLPNRVVVNKFLNLEGKKFSKSRGIVIAIKDMVQEYGNDLTRFYLTAIMPENKESSFSWSDFAEKVNKDLVGTIGNFIHRVVSIAQGADFQRIAEEGENESYQIKENFFNDCRQNLTNSNFKQYLASLTEIAKWGNGRVQETKLWELKKKEEQTEFYQELKELYLAILSLAYLLNPLLPEASFRLISQLGLTNKVNWVKKDNHDLSGKNWILLWPKEGEETEYFQKLLPQIDTETKPQPLFKKVELEKLP